MKSPELYKGREQTYLKHLFLENYLERVAYNVFSFKKDFVYVDGFSGPWRSKDEDYEDTSFKIAINKLRNIREGIKANGKDVNFRCLFIEKDPTIFKELEKTISTINDVQILPICGDFESLIPKIIEFIGNSFSLVFIDPKGWTGFGLQQIQPLLKLRGEVIVNFMFDFINRFTNDPRPETARTFDPLFGGAGWDLEVEKLVDKGKTREEAIINVYCNRARLFGSFPHVTSTRVKKPLVERSYFYLVYCTRHWKGLVEFREIEKKTIRKQEEVRNIAKFEYEDSKTDQIGLFGVEILPELPRSFEDEREKQLSSGFDLLIDILKNKKQILYEDVLGHLLELHFVWESDVKRFIRELMKGDLCIRPDMAQDFNTTDELARFCALPQRLFGVFG